MPTDFEVLCYTANAYRDLLQNIAKNHTERPMVLANSELYVLEQAWKAMQSAKLYHLERMRHLKAEGN